MAHRTWLVLLGVWVGMVACAPAIPSRSSKPPSSSPSATVSPSAKASNLPIPTAAALQTCADLSEPTPCLAGSTTVEFVSPAIGWVVGPDVVLATTTGGRRWVRQLDAHQPILGADFVDAYHGWVVGVSTLFRTMDGGNHWVPLGDLSPPLWSVHFVSALHGWGIAASQTYAPSAVEDGITAPPTDGRVVATTDGGRTWSLLNAPANATSVCFANGAQGWLGVTDAVYRSIDGGATWQLSFTDPASPASLPGDTAFVECAAAPAVWVYFYSWGAALSHKGYASVATVDGFHWRAVLDEPYTESYVWGASVPAGPGSYPGPFSVVSTTSAVYLGFTPPVGCGEVEMVVGSKGGAALGAEVTVPLNTVDSAAFLSTGRGWVVGAGFSPPGTGGCGAPMPEVLTTSDAGRTWTVQYTGPL